MAEAAFLAVGKSVVSKLADLVAQEISLACCTKEELRKLQGSLGTINDTLQAFEEGQYIGTSPTNNWLEKLKDVAYDAEDVLDEFVTEVSRQRMEQICFCTLDEVWEFSSRLLYYFKLGHQIKEIRGRLENITMDRNNFHPIAQPNLLTSPVDVETDSLLSDDVIGRDKDKDEIVKLLMELEHDNARNAPVIPIVGMGGVGKTTFARLVFNDEVVAKHFDLKVWVCVSNDFDKKTIAKNILECVTKNTCDCSQMEVVQDSLRKELDGKRYLLVLDDVWNEDHEKWVPVEKLFQGAKEGSKILVTTRSSEVASIMSPPPRHFWLGPLSNDEQCWSVFKQRAFREREEENYKTTLVPIGREIVRKCGGVPLAITALGSLLKSKTNESYWEFVRDTDIWKLHEEVNRNEGKSIDIMPILKFSYYHLPPHLKACFAYCSLFPKDHEIVRETLILLWMANGLILPSTRPMEDVGNEYFHILLSRSFFQDAEKDDDDGSIRSCKMHDLMHDLARSIGGTEYLIVGKDAEVPQGSDIQGSTRHIWLSGELNPQLLIKAHQSRTLLKPFGLELPLPYNKCLSFKRLRALDLSWSNLERLPDSICELKHLRYLDLSYSRIRALPDSFSRLQNLQTLIVCDCIHLERLPDSICELKHLRHLDLSFSRIIRALPDSFGRLQNLQTLIVRNCLHLERLPDSICELKHLRYFDLSESDIGALTDSFSRLQNLQTLIVRNCLHLDRLPDSICELKHLRYLDLYCSPIRALPDSFGRLQNLQTLIVRNCLHLERLPDSICELKHLRYLDLSSSGIKALPDSFSRLQNLQTLDVSCCQHLGELPKDMWKMVNLRHIINEGSNLTHMPSGLGQLSSLRTLQRFVVGDNIGGRISELGLLDGLRGELRIQNLERVKDPTDARKASLEKKQNLNFLTLGWESKQIWNGRQQHDEDILGHLHPPTNLKKLFIYGYAGVKFAYLRMSTLERLVSIELCEFSGCQHLSLGDLPSLQFLSLDRMPYLECIDGGFMSLEKLRLDSLPKLEKWGGQLSYLPRLTTLQIDSCPSLVEMPFFPSLETWVLRRSRGELLLRSMTSTHTSSTLSGIRTLKSLCIVKLDDLEHLPAEGWKNLVSLERLNIWCSSLKSLSEDILQHLFALRSLSIHYCPMITSLPISPHITHLSIEDCPMLTSLPISEYITHLSIVGCRNATWLEAEADDSLTGFRSLQELHMEFLPKVVSLPKALQHATSLQSLEITDCDGLTTIPEWLANLASLQKLVLESCPLLTSLPKGMQRLTSLQKLEIRACPHLYWRCKEETGEDWAKIVHIQNKIVSEDIQDKIFPRHYKRQIFR